MTSTASAPENNTALVLVHFQRCIAEPGVCFDYSVEDAQRIAAAIDRAGELASAARQAKSPVVHIAYRRNHGEPFRSRTPLNRFLESVGAFEADTPGFDFVDTLAPVDGETVIEGYGVSGFVDTDLHQWFHQSAIIRLVLAGITTSSAVESTARHASDLGYQITIAADACVDESPETHRRALDRLSTIARVEHTSTTAKPPRIS